MYLYINPNLANTALDGTKDINPNLDNTALDGTKDIKYTCIILL